MWVLSRISYNNVERFGFNLSKGTNISGVSIKFDFINDKTGQVVTLDVNKYIRGSINTKSIIALCDNTFGVGQYTGVHDSYIVKESPLNWYLYQHLVDIKVVNNTTPLNCGAIDFDKTKPYMFFTCAESKKYYFTLSNLIVNYPNNLLVVNNMVYVQNKKYLMTMTFDNPVGMLVANYRG
jgi:hypothetical protein